MDPGLAALALAELHNSLRAFPQQRLALVPQSVWLGPAARGTKFLRNGPKESAIYWRQLEEVAAHEHVHPTKRPDGWGQGRAINHPNKVC